MKIFGFFEIIDSSPLFRIVLRIGGEIGTFFASAPIAAIAKVDVLLS